MTTTSKIVESTFKKQKVTIENDNVEEFCKITFLILTIYLNNGDMINSGNLMFRKHYIKYWKHFSS